jgi:hypothetical protein
MFSNFARFLLILTVLTGLMTRNAWPNYRSMGKATLVKAQRYPMALNPRRKIQDLSEARSGQWGYALASRFHFRPRNHWIHEIDGWFVPSTAPTMLSMCYQP